MWCFSVPYFPTGGDAEEVELPAIGGPFKTMTSSATIRSKLRPGSSVEWACERRIKKTSRNEEVQSSLQVYH